MDLYNRYSDQLNIIATVTSVNECWPSIAKMLEWLEDASRKFNFQYLCG